MCIVFALFIMWHSHLNDMEIPEHRQNVLFSITRYTEKIIFCWGGKGEGEELGNRHHSLPHSIQCNFIGKQ